jgi:hypothetical protein
VELAGQARRIALAILTYLLEHPEAKDSLAGIRLWWIDEPDTCSDQDLWQAAEGLVERGLLSIWESSPGSVVFGPSEKFLGAPETLLREFASEPVRGNDVNAKM